MELRLTIRLLAVLLAAPAFAQTPTTLQPGDIGVFADPSGTVSTVKDIGSLQPFEAWVVVGSPGPIDAYEFRLRL